MFKIFEEITEWDDNTPNHSYALNEQGKMVAYKRNKKGNWKYFGKPRMFDPARRKFKKYEVEKL